jgi:hypothetical protein
MIGLCIERIQGVSKVLLTDRQNCRFLGLVFKKRNTQNSKLLLAGLEHILRAVCGDVIEILTFGGDPGMGLRENLRQGHRGAS